MKIGIDARFYSPRHAGPSRYTRELIKNLLKIDAKNQYILFMTKEDRVAFRKDFPKKLKNVKISIVDFPHYSIAEQIMMIRHLNSANIDLVHFLHFNHPILYRKPYIITIFDLTLSFFAGRRKNLPFKKWAYNWTLLSAINHSKEIITVSENTKKELIERMNAPKEKISVTYLGADKKFAPSKNQKEMTSVLNRYKIKKPYIIYTGQWRTHKNLIRLVQGFDKAIKNGLEAQLVIVGKKDPLFPELPRAVKARRLEKRVILTDFVPDQELPYLYNGASAFVFPSLAEGFGLPPLEAMACGIPVVSSKASCLPEVLGKAALYFDPLDTDDIAKKITKMIKDKKTQNKYRMKGFDQVKKYSWEKMAKQTLLVYNQVYNQTNSKTQMAKK